MMDGITSQKLIDVGANVNASVTRGDTPLLMATFGRNVEVAEVDGALRSRSP